MHTEGPRPHAEDFSTRFETITDNFINNMRRLDGLRESRKNELRPDQEAALDVFAQRMLEKQHGTSH